MALKKCTGRNWKVRDDVRGMLMLATQLTIQQWVKRTRRERKRCSDDNMDGLHPPPALQFTGNVAENWRRFKQRFAFYLLAIGLDEASDKKQAAMFLHVVVPEATEEWAGPDGEAGGD